MSEKVQLIKLITSEEIIATVDRLESNLYVTDAIQVIPQQGPPDPKTGKSQIVFGFIPWGTLAKAEIVIGLDKVVFITDPEEEILKHYNTMMGKVQIQVPPKNLVLAR